MSTLKEVAEARAIMTEALDWSVMKWLTEKKRVRHAADAANALLDRVEQELHDSWDADTKAAYAGKSASPELLRYATSVKETHDAAIATREDAEATFEKAEKRLSVSMAREGCHKAIAGWDLHEEAIRKAEAIPAKR